MQTITNIQVLGIDRTDLILIWVSDTRRLHRIDIDSLKVGKLIQYAGRDSYEKFCDTLPEDARSSAITFIKHEMADLARANVIDDDQVIGQGVWRLQDTGGPLVVTGNTPLVYRNGTFEILDSPIYGDRLIDMRAEEWVSPADLISTLSALTPEQIRTDLHQLESYLGDWQFSRSSDRSLVVGMAIALMIQGGLTFRPQVWVSGPTNSGKSALKSFLKELYRGSAYEFESETSAAGLKATIGANSLPVLLDEQEPWHGSKALRKLSRTATRTGGRIVKGSPTGKPIVSSLQHCLWSFSINTQPWDQADYNRSLDFELLPGGQITMPPAEELSKIGLRLLVAAVICLDDINKLWESLSRSDPSIGRMAEVLAVPVVIRTVLLQPDDLEDSALEAFREVIDERATTIRDMDSDLDDLRQSILGISVMNSESLGARLDRGREFLKRDVVLLQTVGVKPIDNCDTVFFNLKILQTKLAGTKWADVDLRKPLLRLGAESHQCKFNGSNCRGMKLAIKQLLGNDWEPSNVVEVEEDESATKQKVKKPQWPGIVELPPVPAPPPAVESILKEIDSMSV